MRGCILLPEGGKPQCGVESGFACRVQLNKVAHVCPSVIELLADRVIAEAARVQPDLLIAAWTVKKHVSNDISHAEGRDMVAQLCTERGGEGVAVLLKVTAMLSSRWALEEHVGDILSPVQLVGGDGAAVRASYQLRAVFTGVADAQGVLREHSRDSEAQPQERLAERGVLQMVPEPGGEAVIH